MTVTLTLTDAQADLLVEAVQAAWWASVSPIPPPAQDMTRNEELTWRSDAAARRNRAAHLGELLETIILAIRRGSA